MPFRSKDIVGLMCLDSQANLKEAEWKKKISLTWIINNICE